MPRINVWFRGTEIQCLTDFVNDRTVNSPDCNQRPEKQMKRIDKCFDKAVQTEREVKRKRLDKVVQPEN